METRISELSLSLWSDGGGGIFEPNLFSWVQNFFLFFFSIGGWVRGATFSMFSPYVFFWSLPLSRNIFILFCFLTIIDQLELKCQVCLCVYWKIKWGETQELLCRSEWQISPFIKCILSKNYLMKFILSSPLSNTFGQVHLFKDTAWSNTIRRSHFFFRKDRAFTQPLLVVCLKNILIYLLCVWKSNSKLFCKH